MDLSERRDGLMKRMEDLGLDVSINTGEGVQGSTFTDENDTLCTKQAVEALVGHVLG